MDIVDRLNVKITPPSSSIMDGGADRGRRTESKRTWERGMMVKMGSIGGKQGHKLVYSFDSCLFACDDSGWWGRNMGRSVWWNESGDRGSMHGVPCEIVPDAETHSFSLLAVPDWSGTLSSHPMVRMQFHQTTHTVSVVEALNWWKQHTTVSQNPTVFEC